MARGFADWTDLGVFPAQDVEEGVPIGTRMTLVAGRVARRPEAGGNGQAELTEYAREHGLGTLGDVHPWLFWQTKEREKRAMGSWSMAWGGVVSDSASALYGGKAGVQPLTRDDDDRHVGDVRYRVLEPAWSPSLPWQPEGMLATVLPSTSESNPGSVMLSGDRRLVAAGTTGPGQAGTTIVDMQPEGVLCMDGSENPGQHGRHARLQGLVRVVALGPGSGGPLGGADLNGIALNYGLSQQDGILGFGMIFGPATDGGGSGGGSTTDEPNRAITPGGDGGATGQTNNNRPGGDGGGSAPSGPGGPPPPPGRGDNGFAGPPTGGAFDGGGDGENAGFSTAVDDYGAFAASPRGGYAVGFMSAAASGPITHGCRKHVIGADKDGHPMTSAHIGTGAYFYSDGDRDGPLLFEDQYPDTTESAIPTAVHLSWDGDIDHGFISGTRPGVWKWWTTVPYVESEDDEEEDGGGGAGGNPGHPSTPSPGRPTTPNPPAIPPPNAPGAPGRPNTPGSGQPAVPGAPQPPQRPNTPGTPTIPPTIIPRRAITPGAITINPPGSVTDPRQDPGADVKQPPGEPRRAITPGAFDGPAAPPTPNVDVAPFPGMGTDFNGLEPFTSQNQIRSRKSGVVHAVGGSADGRDVGLYGILHPFNTGFASISMRPQLWTRGAPNFEHNPLLGANAYKTEEKLRPTVLTIRAWGAQNDAGDWDYVTRPNRSRARGGTANGGLLLAPPEFEMEDYLGINSAADTDSPTTSVYAVVAPGAGVAFGAPALTGHPANLSKLIHQDTAAGELLISELDATGAKTNIAKASVVSSQPYFDIQGDGATRVPVGNSGARPAAPATGMFRYNSGLSFMEYYNGSSWQQLTNGPALAAWTDLNDTPAALVALKISAVNAAGTAFEFPGIGVTAAGLLDGNAGRATNFGAATGAGDLVESAQATALFFPFTGGTITGNSIVSGAWFRMNDNDQLRFGSGADARIVYDGTNLSIKPDVVGSGKLVIQADACFVDDDGVQFGTGIDAEIIYDGSDLVLNPALVGSGAVRVSGELESSSTARFETAVAIGQTGDPDGSAALEIESTSKGVLFPRMTTGQRNAIGSPVAGLVIYNTTSNNLNFYNGSSWGAV